MAVCVTDFVQGTLMLIGLLIVPLVAYLTLSGSLSDLLTQSGAPGGAAAFLNPFENGERPYTFVEIFSQLAWGLGYCGMPHILTRFMAVKSEKELKKSSAIAIVWDILSLTAACFIGIIGRAYLLPTVLGENGASSSESVFIEMINKLFSSHLGLPFIGGIFLCGILAAIMSTADSQLLVTASAASEDLYHQFIKKDADSKEILAVARFTGYRGVCSGICDRVESEQQYYGTGIQCMGRSWCSVWSDCGNVTVLEKNKPYRCSCRYCFRWSDSYRLGLYTACGRTDSWFLYRTLFSGCRFCCQPCDDHYLQSGYESTIQRNHR